LQCISSTIAINYRWRLVEVYRSLRHGGGGGIHPSQILPKGVINLEGKKILIRLSQAETTKGKNIIIGENREKVRPTTKKLKPTFDKPSTKYKKGNAHIKSRKNCNVWKVKPELPVSPRQADISVAGRCRDSKQSKSSLKAKLRSQDRPKRKLHTTALFPPFRHPMPKPWGPSPMVFHPYAPWFDWYVPPMQYESFYSRSAKYEPNAFDNLTHPKKDRLYPKSRLNVAKTQEQPNQRLRFFQLELTIHGWKRFIVWRDLVPWVPRLLDSIERNKGTYHESAHSA
jgi:hypothetical protein